MALRVLLADESSTIKKAIQMVLSDYGVDVKAVPTGIDVLSVAETFKPDIVLADILLNKKNGYEVSAELKSTESTKDIPVVLMWSSFMQLDPRQYSSSMADASLEKPFDTENLRKLVEDLVPKLQTFPLRGLLNHPPLPDFEESGTYVRQKADYAANKDKQPAAKSSQTTSGFVLDDSIAGATPAPADSENADDFSQVDLNPNQKTPVQDDWSTAPASQFVIETESYGDFEEVKVINARDDENTPDLQKKINEQIRTYLKDSPVASHKAQSSLQQKPAYSSFDEQLMREEIRQVAERICWQVIPEITEKIVREELAKLMQGIEKNI